MKDWKKQIKAEKKEIADADREFLEETLYPIADKNAKERKHKRWRYAGIISSACLVVLCVALGVEIYFLTKPKEDFEDHIIGERSDITTVNGLLENTRLSGDFGYVSLNRWEKKGTPTTFMATWEREDPDITYESATFDVIVDLQYEYEFLNLNNTRTEHLGYTVEYNLRKKTYSDDQPTVYEYNISAYMDTGKERYIIRYSKMSIYDGMDFEAFLQETIKKKQ